MIIECKSNEAFEDLLTQGKTYRALEVKGASYLIETDKGDQRWLGSDKFSYAGAL